MNISGDELYRLAGGIEAKVLSSGEVDVKVNGNRHRHTSVVLVVLHVFAKSRTLHQANELLSKQCSGVADWQDATRIMRELIECQVIIPNDGRLPRRKSPAGYGSPRIHVAMLRDDDRTKRFIDAIKETVKPGDKVVDIGTGTGILAIAAAQAGANQVYAVEANPETARFARATIRENGFESKIQVVEGFSTEVELPERCDVLVSEMIGDEPLGENIIPITNDAILRHLKDQPRLVPQDLSVYCQLVKVPEAVRTLYYYDSQEVSDWQNEYGIQLDSLIQLNPQVAACWKFRTQEMNDWDFVGSPIQVAHIDLFDRQPDPIDKVQHVEFAGGSINGILVNFETQLSDSVRLSTICPHATLNNHWLSPLYLLQNSVADQIAVGYRFGMLGRSNGIYLPEIDKPQSE